MSAQPGTASEQRPDVSLSEVIVGRQPILDRNLEVHGYELLHRAPMQTAACFEDPDAASAEVITSGFTDIGLSRLVDRGIVHLNVTRDFLVGRDPMALPAGRVALEFPGDTAPDAEFLDALDHYHTEGYRLVMDGGRVTAENLALVKRAHAVKLDVQALGLEETARQAGLILPLGREVIAYRVEHQEEHESLEPHGLQYFQGYFFARPHIVSGTRVGASKMMTLRVLSTLYDADAEVDDVADAVARDAGLSYKLMRFMNSAFLSLPGKVDSIHRAVVFMGLAAIKRWASLMVVASVDDKPSELTRTLLVRARLCERLCEETGSADPGGAFTVGLFSGLDALTDCPLEEAVAEMPLAAALEQALLAQEGTLGAALRCALAFEQEDWPGAEFPGATGPEIGALYAESVSWASEVFAAL